MMQKIPLMITIGLCCWLILIVLSALGEESAKSARELAATERPTTTAKQFGPVEIDLRGQAVLNIPKGYAFVPMPAAAGYARALGNKSSEAFVGLIFPERSADGWVGVVEYVDAGHISDDQARSWRTDELFSSYKQAIEANNLARIRHGFSALEVAGWELRPSYDAARHRLAWSAAINSKGRGDPEARSMTYNTYLLGREGYFSLSLVADMSSAAALKSNADALVSALTFHAGKAYDDFNAQTDKIADYEVSALVRGIDPQKSGTRNLMAAFFEKFAELTILVGIALFGVSVGEAFKRDKQMNV